MKKSLDLLQKSRKTQNCVPRASGDLSNVQTPAYAGDAPFRIFTKSLKNNRAAVAAPAVFQSNLILALLMLFAAALGACASHSTERAFIAPPPDVTLSRQDSYFSKDDIIAANLQPAAGEAVDAIEQSAQDSRCAALRTNFSKNEPLSVDMGESRLGIAMASDRNDFDPENTHVAARATVRYSLAIGGGSAPLKTQSCGQSFWSEFRDQS